jgi:hypothetical protein
VPPFQETGPTAPSGVRSASTLMRIQGALYPVFIVLGIAAAAARRNNEAAEESTRRGGPIGLIVLLFALGLVVSLFVLASKLKNLDPGVRTKTIVVESFFLVVALLSLLGGVVLMLVIIGLAVAVIVRLSSAEARAAFSTSATTAADAASRFDVRNFPDV